MNLSQGIDLDQYKTQAKDLLKQIRSGQSEALDRLRQHHPEQNALISSGKVQLADSQLVIARENGFPSWAKFKIDLLFRQAVRAMGIGDVETLKALLDRHPTLIRYRAHVGEPYEEGYFAGAPLIYHLAGNPDMFPIPSNVLDVARILISKGVDQKDAQYTNGLLITSRQASEAKVAVPLIDLLTAAGAIFDLGDPEILSSPLLNVAPETAKALIQRGAKADIRHAAGLGDVALLKEMLSEPVEQALLEEALAFACIRGQLEAVKLLIGKGARGDVLLRPGGRMTPRTSLHEAANRGYVEIVRLLMANGADATVVEPRWGGTAAGWAEAGGHFELANSLRNAKE
jgi:hypothetical protein